MTLGQALGLRFGVRLGRGHWGQVSDIGREGPGPGRRTLHLVQAGSTGRGRNGGEKAAVGGALGRGSERAGPAQRGRGPGRPAEDGAMTAEPQKRCEGTESRKAGGWRGGARPPAAHTAPRTATRLVLPTAHTRTGSSCPCAWPFSAQSGDTPYAITTATGPGPRTVLWSPRIRPFLPEFYSTHMKV